ncbi:Protein of unknown function [Pyronema omphalodes CBS 100304]|uniref:Uncharacterized protein n=1 Tax=Pyronema omphalodes (strain CBS 100304) TaxID=1076935 RepID=U4LRG9_PYROM|nr:Protein of unknown function [Pyronema omphalodes CBS 100304]
MKPRKMHPRKWTKIRFSSKDNTCLFLREPHQCPMPSILG